MNESITILKDKELGLIKTPKRTAEYIISKVGPIKEGEKVLDPCVGPGVFVKSLLEAGVDRRQIFTHDLDDSYHENMDGRGVHFEAKDTLSSITPESHDQFDFIVGNPPYLNKASAYVRKHKKELRNLYGHVNSHETYAMFLVNGIWRLKEGGRLGFITSDSFLTLKTHEKLREFLLDHCLIHELLLAPEGLFDGQGVSTSPAILIVEKCTGHENAVKRKQHVMRVIPRIRSEKRYENPPKINEIRQEKYHILPFKVFFTDIEPGIVEMFKQGDKLKKHVRGYIGMHTHDNMRYIAAIEGSELAEIFQKRNRRKKDGEKRYRIISEKEFKEGQWMPYLKRGGMDQYYRPIMEALEWREESIPIYDIPKRAPFKEEGIVISGVSSRLAARHMPSGCYWDSNKAIGFIVKNGELSIEYLLGLLNSSLYNYLAKGIINNTSSIQLTGLHALPLILPSEALKSKVEQLVHEIIKNKKRDGSHDYREEQEKIDDLMFQFHARKFNLSNELKQKLDQKYSINS